MERKPDEEPEASVASESAATEWGDGTFERLLQAAARVSDLAPRDVLAGGDQLYDGRFTIRRALGQGGMGVVYEAWDRGRHAIVALKTLTRSDPRAIYFLKNEFRSVADITHPNLVALYEFFEDAGRWFFTMERVRGVDFVRHVTLRDDPEQTRAAPEARFDPDRLQDALAQLTTAVAAVHAAGKLHCDLKPSNVMVEPGGRLVVLDFGLVSEQHGERVGHTLGPMVGGTPGYMAPEQVAASPRPESDLYAVGVMLFEALTGRLPFEGSANEILVAKQTADAPRPSQIARGVPEALDALCAKLLCRDPDARASAQQVLDVVGADHATPPPRAMHASDSTAPAEAAGPFVGRDDERRALQRALELTREGAPRAVVLVGPPGIGKTRLLHEFVREAEASTGALSLRGRCHERECIPFNAFDRIVDALSRHLRRLEPLEAASLLPRDAHTLARLFPVLARVAAVVQHPGRSPGGLDPTELRRRGCAALRDLLARISDVSPLVLAIDDLHWADEDSLRLLRDLCRGSDPPAMLVAVTLHEGAAARSFRELDLGIELERLEVPPLSTDESRALLASLSGDARDPEELVREAGGSPFFLGELARHTRSPAREDAGLDAMIVSRHAQLPATAQRVLDVLALNGRAMDLSVLQAAAELESRNDPVLSSLAGERWLRAHRAGEEGRVELYHGHMARTLATRIEPTRARALHRSIAIALEGVQSSDLERVGEHWLSAGEPERAASCFVAAAEAADESCAFALAGQLYARGLEHGHHDESRQRVLYQRLGDAHSRAGRGSAAAHAYLRARDRAEQSDARTALARLAAQHLLASGELDEGTAVLRSVLHEAGERYPETPERAEHDAAALRAQLDVTQAPPAATSEAAFDAALLAKIDVCCVAGPALGSYDFVRSGYFAARGLSLALEAAEPLRLSRALSAYSTSLASSGALPQAKELAQRALTLAREHNDGELIAGGELALGQVALFEGDFERALSRCDAARARFRGLGVGASQEIPICDVFSNMALYLSGELAELVTRSREQLIEARDLGHRFREASLRSFGVGLGALLDDDPDAAREHARLADAMWPQQEFHGERFKVLRLEAWCDLYAAAPQAALARMEQARETALESRLLDSRYWRFWWLQLTAQVQLAAAAAGLGAGHVQQAERAVEQLERERLPYAEPYALLYRAALTHLAAEPRVASELLTRAMRLAHPVLAAAIEYQEARIRSDAMALERSAARLRAVCRRPDRLASFLAPGFPVSSADGGVGEPGTSA